MRIISIGDTQLEVITEKHQKFSLNEGLTQFTIRLCFY